MNDKTAGGSAQAEYERRAARHADDLRHRRPRILAFGAAIAIVAVVVAVVTQPLYGAVVLMLDLILVMSALFNTPNSITAWQIGADGEVRTASATIAWFLCDRPTARTRIGASTVLVAGVASAPSVATREAAGPAWKWSNTMNPAASRS